MIIILFICFKHIQISQADKWRLIQNHKYFKTLENLILKSTSMPRL